MPVHLAVLGTNTFQGYEYSGLDGDLGKLEAEDPIADPEVLRESASFGLRGKAATSANMPTRLLREISKKFVYDFEWTPHGMFLVSDRAKQLVEKHEPGVHQFWPMEVVWKDGTILGNRHLLIICNRIDSISNSQTQPEIKRKFSYRPDRRGARNRICFNKNVFQGKHIWIEKRLINVHIVSKEFWIDMKDAGITGFAIQAEYEEICE